MPEPKYPRRSSTYGMPRTTLSMRPLTTRKVALNLYKEWWHKTHGYEIHDETVLFTNLEQNSDKYREILRAVEAAPNPASVQHLDCIKSSKKGTTI